MADGIRTLAIDVVVDFAVHFAFWTRPKYQRMTPIEAIFFSSGSVFVVVEGCTITDQVSVAPECILKAYGDRLLGTHVRYFGVTVSPPHTPFTCCGSYFFHVAEAMC